jgi:hypothetical protein
MRKHMKDKSTIIYFKKQIKELKKKKKADGQLGLIGRGWRKEKKKKISPCDGIGANSL